MANRLDTEPCKAPAFLRFSLLLLLCLGAPGLQAQIISDLLIVLEPDGRHYLAQHTLSTDANLIVAELPATRISLETQFSGSERLTFATAHELNPNQLSLWSGSAWTRYRHHYGDGLSEPETGVFELNTDLEVAQLQIDEPGDVQWSLTWVLPDNARVTDFEAGTATPSSTTASDPGRLAPAARWQTSGQVLTFRQSGGKLPSLRIRYVLDTARQPVAEACLDTMAGDDSCAPDTDDDAVPDIDNDAAPLADDDAVPDIDNDAVPDFRDICLPSSSNVIALLPPVSTTPHNGDALTTRTIADDLGCDHAEPQVLTGVHFRSGQAYLDVASRTVLDRVASALQNMPEQRFELGSHTDNAGRVDVNQRLSEDRAQAVRHYLLVRGVDTRQLEARGYGETLPAYDKTEAAGRRANRRIELRRLD